MTTGLLPGGGGGSETSVVTVAASSTNRIRTVPPVTSRPPGGRGPVRVTTGGSPRSVNLAGTGRDLSSSHGSSSRPMQYAST